MKFQDLCCMKLLEKSALLQNKVLGLLWLFANVLMCVGKKDAGKKNKFWAGKGFEFFLKFSSLFLGILII